MIQNWRESPRIWNVFISWSFLTQSLSSTVNPCFDSSQFRFHFSFRICSVKNSVIFIEYFICDFNSKNIFPRHSKCLPKLPSRIPRSLCKLLNYLNMHIYPLKVQNWPLDMTWKAPTTTLFQDIEIRSTYNTQWKNGFLFILLHNLESIWNSVETFTLMSESFCYQSRYMVVCTRSHCGTQLPHPLPLTNKLVTFNQGEKLLPQILGGFD